MKRLFALLLALALLAGCGRVPGLDALTATPPPVSTLPPPPDAAPAALAVGGPLAGDGAAAAAVRAYGAAMGVACTFDAGAPGAALALLAAPPEGADCALYTDLREDPLLLAAAARAGLDTSAPVYALPVGRSLYAWWADGAVLDALLGEGCLVDVQNATWAEWSAFAAAVTAWLAAPAETEVTLNGQRYTLPAQKPAEAGALAGVFALPGDTAGLWPGAAACTAALLAAGDAPRTAEALAGPVDGLCSAFLLELQNAVPQAARAGGLAAQLQSGRALFARASLAAADPALARRVVWVPFKGEYTESDLSTETYNLTGLTNYPTLAGAGYLAIPAGLDEAQRTAAASAILWLYTSAVGESALIDDLLLISPWDTADGTTAAGAAQVAQVEAGILPAPDLSAAQGAALCAAWQGLAAAGDPAGAGRTAFRETLAAALAAPQP